MSNESNSLKLSKRANLNNPIQATKSRSVGTYSPDILNCLANLSSDEVFTSPELASRMLDLLPQELFSSPKTRILDPCCKSGVFLREAAKRLLAGLEQQIPDLQQRIDHIMTKQLFGIACTDLTAEMSRRTLYCSKHADGKYSVSEAFKSDSGNVWYQRCQHKWNAQGRCEHCGASKGEYLRTDTRESYAYPFIHKPIKEIFSKSMQFDVIIGNPPYQMSDGGNSASATPIYQYFIEHSKHLNPRYLIMIIPARWFAGGKGLDDFRATMISDTRLKHLEDYLNASDCFGNGVEIKGGVCFFLWDRDYNGACHIITHTTNGELSESTRFMKIGDNDVFIRRNEAVSILDKVLQKKEHTFDCIVSSRKPFGLPTNIESHCCKESEDIVIYQRGGTAFIKRSRIERNKEWVSKFKIYISKAYNAGDDFPHQILNKPILGGKDTCCSETYILIGPFDKKEEYINVKSYIQTKFFRFLVSLRKISQDATSKVYQFVPLQDFSHPWTDEMLYKKYGLDDKEIAFIESMIRPME